VGSASSLPSKSPVTIAVPIETRICSGNSVDVSVGVCAIFPLEGNNA
jgi:hypothetical protein